MSTSSQVLISLPPTNDESCFLIFVGWLAGLLFVYLPVNSITEKHMNRFSITWNFRDRNKPDAHCFNHTSIHPKLIVLLVLKPEYSGRTIGLLIIPRRIALQQQQQQPLIIYIYIYIISGHIIQILMCYIVWIVMMSTSLPKFSSR